MAELYTIIQEKKQLLEHYERISERYGWVFDKMDLNVIALSKHIKLRPVIQESISQASMIDQEKIKDHNIKLIESLGYQLESIEQDCNTYTNESAGEGVYLTQEADYICLIIMGDKEIKKSLTTLLTELNSITQQ